LLLLAACLVSGGRACWRIDVLAGRLHACRLADLALPSVARPPRVLSLLPLAAAAPCRFLVKTVGKEEMRLLLKLIPRYILPGGQQCRCPVTDHCLALVRS
jgi:hypothetical protein